MGPYLFLFCIQVSNKMISYILIINVLMSLMSVKSERFNASLMILHFCGHLIEWFSYSYTLNLQVVQFRFSYKCLCYHIVLCIKSDISCLQKNVRSVVRVGRMGN